MHSWRDRLEGQWCATCVTTVSLMRHSAIRPATSFAKPWPKRPPGRLAIAPCPPLQLPAIGFGDLDLARPRRHEKWWLRPSIPSRIHCGVAIDATILDAMTAIILMQHEQFLRHGARAGDGSPSTRNRPRVIKRLFRDLLRRGWAITRDDVDGGALLSRLDCPLFSPSRRVARRARTCLSDGCVADERPVRRGVARLLQGRRRRAVTAQANRLTKSSAVCATSRQPWSIVRAWPRFGIFTISVTAGLRLCRL
jgi:hypothetical protein